MIRLVAGLGNPGARYERTRHNVGFEVLDGLASALGVVFANKRACHADIAEAAHAGRRILLAKPTTFMNLSGNAVQEIARKNGIEPAEILVVYDEVELPLGRLRLRERGSAAGHNGVAHIIERLGSNEFPRLRIGVGPRPTGEDLVNYVLSKWSENDCNFASRVKTVAVEACLESISRGVVAAMNTVNAINLTKQEQS